MRPWQLVPGCPAAGHISAGGFWHPGRTEGCVKCWPALAFNAVVVGTKPRRPRAAEPVDPELFARTAPRWNCVDFPGEGMHYRPRRGPCLWCGS